MQPYFMPYIGYFQLIEVVDEFVVYDNIQYSSKGWVNRNRILVNGKDEFITLTLRKDSSLLDVKDRMLADSWPNERIKLLNRIKETYRKAPFFEQVFPLIESCVLFTNTNLFEFIYNSLICILNFLESKTKITISSSISINHELKSEERVKAICKQLGASVYINPIGGVDLYSKKKFSESGIELNFLQATNVVYRQFDNEFVPWLSILDVLMFNNKEAVKTIIQNNYKLI